MARTGVGKTQGVVCRVIQKANHLYLKGVITSPFEGQLYSPPLGEGILVAKTQDFLPYKVLAVTVGLAWSKFYAVPGTTPSATMR